MPLARSEVPRHYRPYEAGTAGIYRNIPGLGFALKAWTTLLPLGLGKITERDSTLYVEESPDVPQSHHRPSQPWSNTPVAGPGLTVASPPDVHHLAR